MKKITNIIFIIKFYILFAIVKILTFYFKLMGKATPKKDILFMESFTLDGAGYTYRVKHWQEILIQKGLQVELLFKQLKQNFPLKFFLSANENAIKIRIWYVLIENFLLTAIQKKIKSKGAFSNLVSFCTLHLLN